MLKTKAPIWMSVNEPLHFRMKRGFVRACVWVLYADATTCMQWPSSNHCLTAMCLHRGGVTCGSGRGGALMWPISPQINNTSAQHLNPLYTVRASAQGIRSILGIAKISFYAHCLLLFSSDRKCMMVYFQCSVTFCYQMNGAGICSVFNAFFAFFVT